MMLEVSPRKPKLVLLALLLLPTMLPGGREAAAEVRITGGPESMNVEANEALLQELLSALRDKFGLSFQSTTPLDKVVSGSFHGSLEQVLSSVLYFKNYSYTYQKAAGHPFLQIVGVDHAVASDPVVANPTLPPPAGQSPKCADQPQPQPHSHISAKYLSAHASELAWRPCAQPDPVRHEQSR